MKRGAAELATFFTLRQQMAKRDGRPNVALSDFVAPVDSGKQDYLGGFVVTAGIEEVAIAERFERANDDYSSIMVKALADRFAEAFAERMHEYVRKELWGYAPDETFTPAELIGEPYAGIRPAPGYPAQPDHTEKATLFRLLKAEDEIGVTLTESFAMWPGSSVSGLYIGHPGSLLFWRRQDRARPGRGLCRTQGHADRRGRTLAGADPELCAGGEGGSGGVSGYCAVRGGFGGPRAVTQSRKLTCVEVALAGVLDSGIATWIDARPQRSATNPWPKTSET